MSEIISKTFDKTTSVTEDITREIKVILIEKDSKIRWRIDSIDSNDIVIESEFYSCDTIDLALETVTSGETRYDEIKDALWGETDLIDIAYANLTTDDERIKYTKYGKAFEFKTQ